MNLERHRLWIWSLENNYGPLQDLSLILFRSSQCINRENSCDTMSWVINYVRNTNDDEFGWFEFEHIWRGRWERNRKVYLYRQFFFFFFPPLRFSVKTVLLHYLGLVKCCLIKNKETPVLFNCGLNLDLVFPSMWKVEFNRICFGQWLLSWVFYNGSVLSILY